MKDMLYRIISDINPYEDIADDTLLLEEGILDSVSLLLVIEEIENELGIKIPEDKIEVENFASINAIISFLNDLR